jgi:hypothetical protein
MSITDITLALANLSEKQREHDEALAGYEGHSWGYHGRKYEDAICVARRELEAALNEHIDARVAEALRMEVTR